MKEKTVRQYGLWDSPITPISLARGLTLADVDTTLNGDTVWLEMRSGCGALVLHPSDDEAIRDLNSEICVRGKVGYGGAGFGLSEKDVFFIDGKSGRIFRQPLGSGEARPITPSFGGVAAPVPSPDGRWLLFVRSYEEMDTIEIVDTEGNFLPQRLVQGEDFYMQPAWHPEGNRIAWIAWNHPNMPWDGTYLRVGYLQFHEGCLPILKDGKTIAGGEEISVFQPEFSPDGKHLAYVSDETGWWQLYLYNLETGEHRQLTNAPAEHGKPAWVQGMRTFTFDLTGKYLIFLRNQDAHVTLWQLDLENGEEQQIQIDPEYTFLDQPAVSEKGVSLIASGGRVPPRVVVWQLVEKSDYSQGKSHILRRATTEMLPEEAYSQPEDISWEGMDGGTAYGLYYPPTSAHFTGEGLPPLVLGIHGGPTSQRVNAFNANAQFFTSRGYAYMEVNYRGSTGYGREYRNKLRGNWGIYDVEDAVSGAKHLIQKGLVDEKRIVIMGGSAGGFTVLKALEDYPGFFKAGICLYGVSNQFTLAADTHKFEAHYTDTLLGKLPEASALYRERSPIFFVDKIQDPIAIFQGEDDVVVPRDQSDTVVESLKRRGVPYIYHLYPGEGHGFRKAETIEHFYKTVEGFLKQYVIFS